MKNSKKNMKGSFRLSIFGFTLVELIAAITILSLMAIIAIPKVSKQITSNKKNSFIVNARNIIRQLEYDNVEFNTFKKIPLYDLKLNEFMNDNLDAKNSYAYVVDDKIFLDLVGVNKYKNYYLCNVSNTKKDVEVQDMPCEEQNFVYIDFEVDLDGGSTNQNFNSKYISDNYLILQIPTKVNDTFLGWELVSGNSVLEQNRIKFGTESTKIKALWGNNPEFFVDLNGGTSNQKFDSKYSGGTLILLQEPTRENYLFKGWKIITGDAILSGNILTTGTKNTVIEAQWELNKYSISYELNGGTAGTNSPIDGIVGSPILISTPTKTGYTFKGWDVHGTGASMSGTILTIGSSDVILIAKWEINTYTISYNASGGTLGSSVPTSGTYGSTVIVSEPTRTGYTFKGWDISGTGASMSGTNLTIGTGDIILTAQWEVNIYTITYNLNDGTAGSSAPTSGSYGSNVTVSIPTRTNYTFTGWSITGAGTTISDTILTIGHENITLTANWKLSNTIPEFTYTGTYLIVDDDDNVIASSSDNWKVRFLSSGTLTFTDLRGAADGIDVFLVGGGGGGSGGLLLYGAYGSNFCGRGGGGGYTATYKALPIKTGVSYSIVIGGGGAQGAYANGSHQSNSKGGSATSAFTEINPNMVANGGSGISGNGAGGSGGGAGGAAGGKDGANGGGSTGGAGQGKTTREFGEADNTLYASGGNGYGGGGGGSNTGNGGNGSSAVLWGGSGGAGGSGIVIIRNKR